MAIFQFLIIPFVSIIAIEIVSILVKEVPLIHPFVELVDIIHFFIKCA